MDKEMRAQRNTAIVTAKLAGEPDAEIERKNGVSHRTIRRLMGRWRAEEFELCSEMQVCIGIALWSLLRRLDLDHAKADALQPGERIEFVTESTALVDYLHLLRDLGQESPWNYRVPHVDWPREINVGVRAALDQHQVPEAAIDAATESVLEWYDRKTDWAMGWTAPPWNEQ
jgi:hypothetical protein